jgi:hypothetical protein
MKHFVLDGAVVVLDKDGVPDFDALNSRKPHVRAQFYAFDVLAGDGECAKLFSLNGIFIANTSKATSATFHSAWGPRHGSRGHCLEASGSRLWRRQMQILDQDQEPGAPGPHPGEGSALGYSVPNISRWIGNTISLNRHMCCGNSRAIRA